MRHEVEAALDQCLEWMRGGTAVETCLSRYPEYASELRPLLETVTQVGRVLTPPASRTARAEGQSRMLAALAKRREQRERLGPVAYGLRQALSILFSAPAGGGLARKPIWQSALLSLVILLFTGSGLALAASGYSLPGEALYPMKLARQELRMALTLDSEDQEALLRQFEAQRRQEVGLALIAGNRGEVSFTGALEDVQSGLWTVAGLSVRVSAETAVSAEPAVGTQIRVLGRLPGDGSLQATALQILGDQREDEERPEATETEPATSPTSEPTQAPTEIAGPDDEPSVVVATPEPTDASAGSPTTGAETELGDEEQGDDAKEAPDSGEPAEGEGEAAANPQPGDDDDHEEHEETEEPATDETSERDDDDEDGPEASSTPDDEDSGDNGSDGDDDDAEDDHDDDHEVTPSPEPSGTPDD